MYKCMEQIHHHGNIPMIFNVFVDHASDHHGNDCVVPRRYEHESEADAHPQKRQSPGQMWSTRTLQSARLCVQLCVGGCVCVCLFVSTSGSRRSGASSWGFWAASAERRPSSQTGNTSGRTWRDREVKLESDRERLADRLGDRANQDRPFRMASLAHIVRMGATRSREAMRIPSSAISAVRRRAQVGSPLAFPCPNTWSTTQTQTHAHTRPHTHTEGKHSDHTKDFTPEMSK